MHAYSSNIGRHENKNLVNGGLKPAKVPVWGFLLFLEASEVPLLRMTRPATAMLATVHPKVEELSKNRFVSSDWPNKSFRTDKRSSLVGNLG